MAQSKIAQQKEKDFDDVVPREGFCDMSEEDQETVVAAAREACKKHHDGEFKYYKTMAIYIKEQLDKKLGGSWHIIVGKLQLLVPSFINSSSSSTRQSISHFFCSFARNELRQLRDLSDEKHLSFLA